ncbi:MULTISPECIES: hypothetical protein [unclassified Lysobacter]|uniref:hypothetical protein n=1 Tax=unclassified Lysobacter TaxID=2635362 RepID=UPI001BE5B358|nr:MULTISPECIES: hypothetical protein [unclassified Lysobacter]MBT2747242.1 hypothetical protein [Lysobacter sp. ISL-42]MBT2750254.1 hypothetical protein [Lysobacter sp. ISL-50]MBT2777780.1 hypothetical protein [Lysobacter sp. ISL-54]MBT2783716.1 hypothetical protein [Lysobacter sp. ISL-52]
MALDYRRVARTHPSFSLALALIVSALASCSTTGASVSGQQASASAKDAITIEHLLRWSLDGEAGKNRIKAALGSVLDLEPLPGQDLSGQGPARLEDGYVLSFGSIGQLTGQIDIGVAPAPCLSPELASKLLGAQGKPTVDAHGEDRGKTYTTQRSGNWINFTTTPPTYRCVDSIHIHPIRASRP